MRAYVLEMTHRVREVHKCLYDVINCFLDLFEVKCMTEGKP